MKMRRILVGAALAGLAFGLSATAASAQATPGPMYQQTDPTYSNEGVALLSQLSLLDYVPVLNGSLNNSLNNNDIASVGHLEDIQLSLLNNN